MPLPALLLVIATLLPLASFALLLFFGKRMGNPFAGYVGTAAIALSFVCSGLATYAWLNGGYAGHKPINIPYCWIPTGPGIDQHRAGFLDVGVYVGGLTLTMFFMVTLVC